MSSQSLEPSGPDLLRESGTSPKRRDAAGWASDPGVGLYLLQLSFPVPTARRLLRPRRPVAGLPTAQPGRSAVHTELRHGLAWLQHCGPRQSRRPVLEGSPTHGCSSAENLDGAQEALSRHRRLHHRRHVESEGGSLTGAGRARRRVAGGREDREAKQGRVCPGLGGPWVGG